MGTNETETARRECVFQAVGRDNMLTIAGYLGAFEIDGDHSIYSEEDFIDGVYAVARRIAAYPEDADFDFWREIDIGAREWYNQYGNINH